MMQGMREHPIVKKALAAGEERIGKLVSRLLSDKRFVAGVQGAVSSALTARGLLDRGVRRLLGAFNLPSSIDLDTLRRRLEEIEALLDRLQARGPRRGNDDAGPTSH